MHLFPSGVENDGFVHHSALRGELSRPTSFPLCTLPPSVAIAARSSPYTVESDALFFPCVTRARFYETVSSATWQVVEIFVTCFPVRMGKVRESDDWWQCGCGLQRVQSTTIARPGSNSHFDKGCLVLLPSVVTWLRRVSFFPIRLAPHHHTPTPSVSSTAGM
jgi:hypothetical protein